jgi:hypothetical protein
MPTQQTVSKIWQSRPSSLYRQLEKTVVESLQRHATADPVRVFFRADDIAVPGKQFSRLMDIFVQYQAPLALAVVPAWLTPQRWSALRRACRGNQSLWCWHQHGWRHQNHEQVGKKQEFGPSREAKAIEKDLTQGKERLASIMKEAWYPMFTPPWNRCSPNTLMLLNQMKFKAVSRFIGAQPAAPKGLAEISLNIDLHTRKDVTAGEGWRNLFSELAQGLAQDRCGIMIHHQRMNDAAFHFMAYLLKVLCRSNRCQIASVKDLIQG